MTAANVPNEIVNLTPADAVPVNANFQYLEGFANSELINRDGSVAMNAPLTLSGSPTQPLQAAPKQYVDSIMPVGMIVPYGGETAPAGDWALCRGATLSTSEYPTLFAVLGHRYGGSGGSFNLPNLQGRFPVGQDTTVSDLNATGKTGGTIVVPTSAHTHTMAHSHTMAHAHSIAHNHGSFGVAGGAHSHSVTYRDFHVQAGGSAIQMFTPYVSTVTSTFGLVSSAQVAAGNGAHSHTIDVPSFSGNSGASSAASTGGASTSTTSSTGTAGAEMRPPFQVVNYIIRTR